LASLGNIQSRVLKLALLLAPVAAFYQVFLLPLPQPEVHMPTEDVRDILLSSSETD
jgi:hypothetical protein